MGSMMEVLDKIMSNITGVTLGALFMIVGLFIEPISSIIWLPNLLIFGGMFIVVMYLSISVRQYVDTVNPNFGRVTVISEIEEETKNATNEGKAKAFDAQIAFYGIMFVAFALLEASWKVLALLMVFFVLSEAIALRHNYKYFMAKREEFLNKRR